MSWPFNVVSVPGVTVTGTGGSSLSQGDVVTGSAVRDIVITQGNSTRVIYGARTPDAQLGSHMLQINIDGTWTATMEPDMGDWSYFTVSILVAASRATVVHKSDDAVEVAFQWDSFDMSSYSGGGIPYLDPAGGLTYPQSSSTYKVIASTRLIKTIRVQRGEPGYYVGWHSSPLVGPHGDDIAAPANPLFQSSTAWGERELGTGGGNAVAWSSAGRTARWPAWADDVDGKWTAQSLQATDNKIWWSGIRKPSYAPYTSAAWIAVQGSGYDADPQSAGPYYVADLHYSIPVAKIMVIRDSYEIGCWKVGTRGGTVLHFANETHSAHGVPYRHQAFIGCKHYAADSSGSYANEPSASIQTWASGLAAGLNWPEV